MSMHVVLLRSREERQYQQYLAILLACQAAQVAPPSEVDMYFGGYGIDNDPEHPLKIHYTPRPWRDASGEGLEIELATLPPGGATIRFYHVW